MFRGASTLNMDTKGRIAIPARYREEILSRSSGNLLLTVNNTRERCLWLYTLDEWERAEKKLVELSSFDKEAQFLKRLLIGYASDCEMDANGRMRISAPLIEFAGLDKRVMLIGQGNKFEVWDETLWNSKRDEWLEEPAKDSPVSEHLANLSL
ncbi:MAG: transcriptional regulator MraZ [marine bacterium B5-7]|nr:MAG: transcriptional regulator MraZ [marine bacterium B5-7]